MSEQLSARFEISFDEQLTISCQLQQPNDRAFVSVLYGSSGCGKTTILRCLAGLEEPDEGTIGWNDETWFDSERRICRSPQRRRVGMLFQDYALFPHLNVAENVGYAFRGASRTDWRIQIQQMLKRFDLNGLQDRMPRQLSGGQQQRVALARVLMAQPRLLLLDEPLSSLDTPTRVQLRPELKQLLGEAGLPAVMVTHDRDEAIAFGDRLIIMDQGKILQAGPVDTVFARPKNATVARLAGVETVVRGELITHRDGVATIRVGDHEVEAVAEKPPGRKVFVAIRGEDVTLQTNSDGASSARNGLPGTILSLIPQGPVTRVEIDCGFPVVALVTQQSCAALSLASGMRVTAQFKASAVQLFAT
jgi:molybdate transport system ATP-binding protein